MPDPSPVLETVAQYRAQLDRLEAQAIGRLARNYARSWRRLELMLNGLLLEIGDASPTRGQLIRLERYQTLMEQIAAELAGLQAATANEIEDIADISVRLGELHARQLLSTTMTGGPGITARFNVLPVDAIKSLLGFLDPAGPLYNRLALLAPTTAQWVADAIAEGVTMGFNPRKIARIVQEAFGRGLNDALRFVRTAQLWAYREANRATMVANGDILEGWVWHADLGPRTCMSCIAMHGTVHPVTETLNDHHNGRCAPIPLVKGYENPVTETGATWFEQQPAAVQQEMMGRETWDAWRGGAFDLSELTTEHVDAVYGPMRVRSPLWQLLGAEPPLRVN